MQFGVTMFVTDYSIGAAEFAVAVEERGFDALFVPDHTHIPAARTSLSPAATYRRTTSTIWICSLP